MKRKTRFAMIMLPFVLGSAWGQTSAPVPVFPRATKERTLEVVQSAQREIWVFANGLTDGVVYRQVYERVQSGVRLNLLIANQRGYAQPELQLARFGNVDARWMKEKIGLTMLVVDHRVAIVNPNFNNQSNAQPSIEISRPEFIAPMLGTVKQLFQTARKLK
jgi:hypothetical protein